VVNDGSGETRQDGRALQSGLRIAIADRPGAAIVTYRRVR
jgi:hypothetical protein